MMITNNIINVKNKKILQLGVLGNWKNYKDNLEDWQFYQLSKTNDVSGLDLDGEGIDVMRKLTNLKLVSGDAEQFRAINTYDIIYAGDIIEHLNNPGSMISCCKEVMDKNTELMISTPNPYSAHLLFWGLFGRASNHLHSDHTFLFDKKNLSILLSRYDLEIISVSYYSNVLKGLSFCAIVSKIFNLLGKINKQWHQSYIIVVKKK